MAHAELRLRKDPWTPGEPIVILSWIIVELTSFNRYERRHLVFERLIAPQDIVTMRLSGDLRAITNISHLCVVDDTDTLHEFSTYGRGRTTLRRRDETGLYVFEYEQDTVTYGFIKKPQEKPAAL